MTHFASGYWWHGRYIVAPPKKQFECLPTPGEAIGIAKRMGKPVRDFTGGLNHPCGCSIGRNLLGEVPHGSCQQHSK